MASMCEPVVDLSTLSLYKLKTNSISSLASQIERRKEVLKKQKEKRDEQISQLRFLNNNENESMEEEKPQWPPRKHRKTPTCPIGMMLAEWLFEVPDDISSWFIIPCPIGQRCLVVVQSHRAHVYGKYGNLLRTIRTNLPRQTILYCIYDNRSSIYHIIDIIMWNGQDYSTQIECQCRFFMLMSLNGDSRLNEQFQILPRFKLEDEFVEAEDGYLFYHPLGFYQADYSPLVCWLKPFMIEELLQIHLSYPIIQPIGYTTAQAYMFEEQSNRKEQQQQFLHRKSQKKKDDLMSID